jgi:hypothetical protein
MMASKSFEQERKAAVKRLAKNPVGPDELSSIADRHAATVASAGYDYRTPYGNFKVNGNLVHAFSYEGAPCGATTIISTKEVPVGDKANAIYAIVHRANAYPKLVQALALLLDSPNIKECPEGRWSTADDVNYRKAEHARRLLRELGEDK